MTTRSARIPALAALLAAFGPIGAGPSEARAQYTYQPGRTVIVTPAAPVVVGGPVRSQPPRRFARRPGRYTAMRPAYGSTPRDRISFAPYSDRYYPRGSQTPTYAYPTSPR